MNFTDIFIRRPVLAMVVSLLIVVLGLRALSGLPVNQYPKTENGVVTISTAYYGADAATVAGFITQPLEAAVSQAQGIDYLSSSSSLGVSTITATLRLNYDSNRALTEINTQVNSVRNQLPPQAQQPVLTVATGQTTDAMYIGFYSDTLPNNNVTDFLVRVVQPKLNAIPGVQTAEILGARTFALRAWLDAQKMAAFGVTATDVSAALAANNYLAAVGASKGQMVTVPLTAGTSLHSVDEFKQLSVKSSNGAIVRLQDVANVTLGSENYDFNVAFNGVRSVFIGIKVAPEANILDVAKQVRTTFPELQGQLPSGLTGKIVYDSTDFINTSISEVIKTLVEALLIVTVVIYLFLGSFRAVLVPVIAMPLSLIGTFFVMLVLGYSINLLTLLALVLAIGLVVDDAIIVVENVDRHMREGKTPLQASLMAARELGGPILAMTVVLVAVYVPIGFQGGLTGSLFTEFAFTLAGAVVVSGVVALTLSPMMCSRIFKPEQDSGKFATFIEHTFERVHRRYQRMLRGVLKTWPVMIVMGLILIGLLFVMFKMSKSELAPEEDQGIVLSQVVGAPTATITQMQTYADQIFKIAHDTPEYAQLFQLTGVPSTNAGIAGVLLKPWDERTRSAHDIQTDLQKRWNGIAGAKVVAFQFPALPGASGLPVQFVIKTTEPFANLNTLAQQIMDKARADGKFYYIDADLKIDLPQATVVVDRDKIASLGITQQDVGNALGAALGGGYVNYFSISGRSYKVIPQVQQVDRLNPSDVLNFYIKTPNGVVPASTVASLKYSVQPETGQPLPAAQLGHHPGRAQRHPGRNARVPARRGEGAGAQRLHHRLFGPVAPVRAGVGQLRHHLPVRADHRVPGTGGAVRKLPRPGGHPGVGAARAVRRHDLHLLGLRLDEHLHAGRAGHADGPHQQARHPDRRGGQPPAEAGPEQARRHRRSGGHAAAAHPDDDRGHGVRRAAARHRIGRRRRRPPGHGHRDLQRAVDRHAVHAVRGAGHVPVHCGAAREGRRDWRAGRSGTAGQGRTGSLTGHNTQAHKRTSANPSKPAVESTAGFFVFGPALPGGSGLEAAAHCVFL
jgi:multidrug efflux pump